FVAATQCRTIDGCYYRRLQFFQATQLLLHFIGAIHELLGNFRSRFYQIIQVTAGEERLLGRGQYHARQFLFFLETIDAGIHRILVVLVHGVGRLALHVHGQNDDIVAVFFVTNMVSHFQSPNSVLHTLDDGGDTHACTHAECAETAFQTATLKFVEHGAENHAASGAQGMAQRNGAAVDVDPVGRYTGILHEAHDHRCERLVHFEQVDIV